jgi:hypothetical protein
MVVPTKNLIQRNWGGPPSVRRLVSGRFGAMPKRRNERLAKQKSVMPVQPGRFPVPTKEFPASAKKFPVPLRREFGCKPLKLPVESTPESQNWARIREIPC